MLRERIYNPKLWKVFYSIMIKHGSDTEEKEWLNVQNAELKSQNQKKLGKWLVAQTKLENACNWKSDSTNARNAAKSSAKY